MTITITKWFIPIVLVLIPFIYLVFRKEQSSSYFPDMHFDTILLFTITWVAALFLTIGYIL